MRQGFIQIGLLALASIIGLGLVVYPAYKKREVEKKEIASLHEQVEELKIEVAKPKVAVYGPSGDAALLGSATGSGLFPTSSLNNFQDGETVNAGDMNGIERKVGINNSTDTSSLDYQLKHFAYQLSIATATITTLTGTTANVTTLNATTSIATASVSSTNVSSTNISVTGLLTDGQSVQYATSTFVPVTWVLGSETSFSKDSPLLTFRATTTLREVWVANNTSGSVMFNLGLMTNTNTATSTWRKLFTADQTISSTTSTLITINGSTTATRGDILGYFTAVASSTEFGVTLYYTTP